MSELDEWLDEVGAHPLSTAGPRATIADHNLWTFSLGDEARQSLTIGEVTSFLRAVVSSWRANNPTRSGEWRCYAWYDEMNGQLRISACPASTLDELPFRCRLRAVEVDDVAHAFIARPQRTEQDFVLDVWMERL